MESTYFRAQRLYESELDIKCVFPGCEFVMLKSIFPIFLHFCAFLPFCAFELWNDAYSLNRINYEGTFNTLQPCKYGRMFRPPHPQPDMSEWQRSSSVSSVDSDQIWMKIEITQSKFRLTLGLVWKTFYFFFRVGMEYICHRNATITLVCLCSFTSCLLQLSSVWLSSVYLRQTTKIQTTLPALSWGSQNW